MHGLIECDHILIVSHSEIKEEHLDVKTIDIIPTVESKQTVMANSRDETCLDGAIFQKGGNVINPSVSFDPSFSSPGDEALQKSTSVSTVRAPEEPIHATCSTSATLSNG